MNYSESTGGNYPILYGMMADSAKEVGSVPPTVEIGEQDVELTVYITYSLN